MLENSMVEFSLASLSNLSTFTPTSSAKAEALNQSRALPTISSRSFEVLTFPNVKGDRISL